MSIPFGQPGPTPGFQPGAKKHQDGGENLVSTRREGAPFKGLLGRLWGAWDPFESLWGRVWILLRVVGSLKGL